MLPTSSALLMGLFAITMVQTTPPPEPELLVVLTGTGDTRDDLPVLSHHPNPDPIRDGLSRGLSGLMLRLYRLEQVYLSRAEGTEPEPAYLFLSEKQGGFARTGFFLEDEDKSDIGYVDVHKDWSISGRFGSVDQIFPHELAHVMRRQLAGELIDGGTNQVHALGVRTDPVIAFNEGFAEHLQAMAMEHPDAPPATAALLADDDAYPNVMDQLARYGRELSARFAFAPRMRMGFVAWYSNGEDVLRYYSIKENSFQREVPVPAHLLGRDPYRAYLLESVLLGDPGGSVKPLPRQVSTEGVVAALFYRWATHETLRSTYRDEAFYEQFGTTAADVPPELNVYLKIVHVLYQAKPQRTLEFIEGYEREFPDEAAAVHDLAREVFGSDSLDRPPELWLANRDFETGTTVFDQYRGLPRTHTFDLNAASLVDLVSVPGVTPDLARAIQAASPFDRPEDLSRVPGVTPTLVARFGQMEEELEKLRAELSEDVTETLSIQSILTPYGWRIGEVILIAALLGGLLHRLLRPLPTGTARRFSWWRTAVNGFTASLVSVATGWALGPGFAPLGVVLLFGTPGALWHGLKARSAGSGGRVLAAWLAAAAPGLLLITPWF